MELTLNDLLVIEEILIKEFDNGNPEPYVKVGSKLSILIKEKQEKENKGNCGYCSGNW